MAFVPCTPVGRTSANPLSAHNSSSLCGRCSTHPSATTIHMAAPSSMDRRNFLIKLSTASLLSLTLSPTAARADRTEVGVKRSYDRYHPRILGAIETIRSVGDAVANNDVVAAGQLVNEKLFYVKGRLAFEIYASSFSDNYVTNRSRAMKKDVDVMFKELNQVAKGGEEMDQHYQKALARLNRYYILARLPMSELSGITVDVEIPDALQN